MTPPNAPFEQPRQSAPSQHPADREFELSDEARAHFGAIRESLARADALWEIHQTRPLTDQEKKELPLLASELQRLYRLQTGSPIIAGFNRHVAADILIQTDDQLRINLRRIRNLNIDLNKQWGTRSARKIYSWFEEDIWNWYGITKRKFVDNGKFLLKAAGMAAVGTVAAAAGTAGLVAGGYALAGWAGGEGAMAGLGLLGQHAGIATTAIGGMFRGDPAAPAVGPVA